MKYRELIVAVLASLLVVTAAEAGPKGNKADLHCPPGLAKKDPPCVPPGQAKKGVTARRVGHDGAFDPYGIGDVLPDGYVTVIDPALFAANDHASYVRQGDTLYRADTTTGEVPDQIGPVGRLIE